MRVFLSHKATCKKEVSKLKQALVRCGISSFVAHEDIEPTEEWQREIERALFSMDALVALLTQDYHDSYWTDQEAGVAIGRGVPLIAVRLDRDPYGLMGKGQGLGGCSWSDPAGMAAKIFGLLHKRLPDKSRLFEAALSAYAQSGSFADSAWKVQHLLGCFATLSPDQIRRVLDAYGAKSLNKSSFDGMDRLKPLLETWTSETWIVRNNELVRAKEIEPQKEDLPF